MPRNLTSKHRSWAKKRMANHAREQRVGEAMLKMERMWQELLPGFKLLP